MADLVSREEVLNIVKDMHDFCRKDALIQSIEDIKALETVDLVTELEKIKKDIDKWRHVRNCSCSDCMDIIDMRIYELKGE